LAIRQNLSYGNRPALHGEWIENGKEAQK